MPTVPVVDQTSVGSTPFSAGGVTPERNLAPEQQEQLGAAVQQAGGLEFKTGQTIGDRVAVQVDDAAVKSAESAALAQTSKILYDPASGYLNQRGKMAIDGYDPAKAAVADAFEQAKGTLGNDIQRHMFQQVQNTHLVSTGQQMAQHNFQQTSQYSGEAAVSRANSFATSASNSFASYGQTDEDGQATGDFYKNMTTAERETLNAVQIMKGAPADSDVAKEALLNVHTQIGTAAVMQMMDARTPFSKVQSVYDDMREKGFLTLQAQNQLGRMVKAYTEQEGTRVVSTQTLSDAYRASQGQPTRSTGTPDYQVPLTGATITSQPYDRTTGNVTVSAPEGSQIQAPAAGVVVKAGTGVDPYMAVDNPKGLVEKGNLPIWTRPTVQNSDGSHSTEYSMSREDDKGREVLVPTVVNGKFLTPDGKKPAEGSLEEKAMFDAAWSHYEKTGDNLGKFSNPQDADAYAESLHKRGEKPEAGPFSVQIQHEDGSVTSIAGITASNVKAGDKVQGGESIASSGPTVLWALSDKNGLAVDPTKAGLPPVDLSKITDEKVLDNALNSMRTQVKDPYLQQQATSEMESIVRHNQQMQNAAATQNFKQASDAFYNAGMNWRSIPASVFNSITPEQQQHFKDAQTEHVLQQYNQGQAFKTMSETDLLSDFYSNPQMITLDNVEAARPNLSRSSYLQLVERSQQMGRNGVQEAQDINGRIKYYAGMAGFKDSDDAHRTDAEKQQYTNLQFKVLSDIDQIKAQNGGKATPDQVNKVIQNELIQRTVNTGESSLFKWTGFGSQFNTESKFLFQVPGANGPNVGDTRKFPNGKTGKWDGNGWVEQVAK